MFEPTSNVQRLEAVLEAWTEEVQEYLDALSPEAKNLAREQLEALQRKNSKARALECIDRFCDVLEDNQPEPGPQVPNPLRAFLLQYKWEGVGGLNWVAERSIHRLRF